MATDLFMEPEKKKTVGDALATALLGGGVAAPLSDLALTATDLYPLLSFSGTGGGAAPSGAVPAYLQTEGGHVSSPDPGTYGKMTDQERSTLTALSRSMSLGNLGLGLFGLSTPLGLLSTMVRGTLRADQMVDPMQRGMTMPGWADWQARQDYMGYQPGFNLSDAQGWGGYSPDPGVNTTDMSLGEAMGIVGGNTDGYGGGDADSGGRSETGGQGESGNAGMWARGGVSHVRRPTRALYGEAGPETAIFIPSHMTRPGLQGPEAMVRRSLRQALMALGG